MHEMLMLYVSEKCLDGPPALACYITVCYMYFGLSLTY